MSSDVASVFDHLSQEDRKLAFSGLIRRRYGPGEFVLQQGGPPDSMYVIESGQADVFVAGPDGVHRFVVRLGDGETFGEMSMLTGGNVSATVRASTTLDVLQLTAEDVRRVGRQFPVIFHNLATILAGRLSKVGGPRAAPTTGA